MNPNRTLFGMSAIFLSANCLIMIGIAFLQSAVKDGSIEDLIAAKIPVGAQPKDKFRQVDFNDEIQKERDNKDFLPSTDDLNDLFTINKPEYRSKWEYPSYGSGLINFFGSLNTTTRRIITLVLWVVATGILVVYSFVVKSYFPSDSRFGFIIMIAILTTDVIVYLIQNAHIMKTATPLAVSLFLNRFFLIVFGSSNWIYGYIIVFICYGLLLTTIIAQKRFPFQDDSAKDFDLDAAAAELKAKKQQPAAEQMNGSVANNALNKFNTGYAQLEQKLSYFRQPEHPAIAILAVYLIVLVVLAIIRPNRVPLPDLLINKRSIHFLVAWAFSIILILAYFTSLVVGRLFIRRKMGSSQKVYWEFKNFATFKQLRIDRYWFFMVLNIFTLISIGVMAWWVTKSATALILIVFIDLYLLTVLNMYTHLIANDFLVLQDISVVNIRSKQFNNRQDALNKEIEAVKAKIMSGDAKAAGIVGGNSDLVERAKNMAQEGEQRRIIASQQQTPQPSPKNNENTWNVPEKLPTKQNDKQPAPQPTNQPQPANVQAKPQPKAPEPPKVQVQVNSEDELINEEMSRANDAAREKGRKNKTANDGIYEGGEAEGPQIQQNLQVPQSNTNNPASSINELEVDPDEEEEVDASKVRIRYKQVEDWRKTHNFFSAFWQAKLRKNDYQIILSWIVSVIVLIIGGWLICAQTNSYIGVTIFIPFAHYSLAIYSHAKTVSTDSPMTIFEYVCFILAYFLQYGWSIWNLWLTYNWGKKDGSLKQDAGLYIVVNLIVIPFITSTVAALIKWIDTKGQLTPFFIVQLILAILQGVGMLVCAFIYMTWVQGVVISCVIGVLIYIAFQVIIFLKNGNYMPRIWFLINLLIITCAIIASFVASGFVGQLSNFIGFSISTWLLAFLLIVFGVGKTIYDIRNMKTRPVFYSPWVFPIYVYNPSTQDVQPNNIPAGSILGSFLLMIMWGVLATAWIAPGDIGVSITILFEHLLLISVIFFAQISHLQLNKLSHYVDNKIIRRAWIDAKQTYVNKRNAINRDELITYEELIMRKNIFRNKMRLNEGRPALSFEEQWEGVIYIPQVTDDQLSSWLNTNLVDLQQPLSCYSYLFEIEKDILQSYKNELQLIVMFQLLIIAYTEIYYDQKKKYLFNFLIEKRSVLLAIDIIINIPANTTVDVQYAKVLDQIKNLPADKFEMFNDLREAFIQEQRVMDDKRKEKAEQEQRKTDEREGKIQDRQRRKREGAKNINKPETPLDQWVDTWEKYEKILTWCKQNGKKFTDSDFKGDNNSLGSNVAQRTPVDSWVRASELQGDQKCSLYKPDQHGGSMINALDVIQGQLGDCYFLSAISVLGEKNVQTMIKTTEQEWRVTGCFCVKFIRDNLEEYVIVDDFFPAVKEGNKYQWIFAKGGEQGDELWPMVLEKAYAKLYGSYENIEAGKVQYALCDMIEGFPQQIDLKNEAKNLEVFWSKITKYFRQGALMGAGSPENPMGDAAINKQGIVQGHAYAILDLQDVDGNKLMMLRNPHGRQGAEWNGEWSDTDQNWNARMKSKLKYEPRDHEDGIFWMDAFDFIQQYSYVYICRILNQQQGWYKQFFKGAWRGPSAEGLPNKTNPSARLELNPQYSVTITKPCDGFIMLKQNEKDPNDKSTFKGKLSIFFMLSKNEGKPIKKVDIEKIVTRSGNPVNLMTISSDCSFDTSVSYPYTFSLLVANTGKGPSGEGEFEVTVYSTDSSMKVQPFA